MAIKRAVLVRTLLIISAILASVVLYCIDVVANAVYANESIIAVNDALEEDSGDPLAAPAVAPLVEILRRDKSEFAAQSVQSLVDLRSLVNQVSIKEFTDRLRSTKAKMTYGVTESTLTAWRDAAEKIQLSAQNGVTQNAAEQSIVALKQEVNKAIVSALVPHLPKSTLSQYLAIKKFIPALPELSDLFSNNEVTSK